jgi:hypothetical protein
MKIGVFQKAEKKVIWKGQARYSVPNKLTTHSPSPLIGVVKAYGHLLTSTYRLDALSRREV